MKNISSYIESGILELYALDQLSAEERHEIELLIEKHPELKNELEQIERSFEEMAFKYRVPVSENVKENILNSVQYQANVIEEKSNSSTNTIAFSQIEKKLRTYKLAFAACFGLLIISSVLLYSNYAQLTETKQQLTLATISKNEIAIRASKLQFSNDGLENMLAMTQSPEWKTVTLKSIEKNKSSKMLVYWNDKNAEVILNYAAMDLPSVESGHEFQLWAIVEGKPKSLGVFSSTNTANKAVISMDKVENAQAFAVTVEPLGGSINPTMEKMIVMGKII